MSSKAAKLGAGDVEVVFKNGSRCVLKPSLAVCIALSDYDTGILGLAGDCEAGKIKPLLFVLETALGKRPKELPQLVYDTGLFNVASPCIRFLRGISNGGKAPDEAEAAVEDGGEEGIQDPLEPSA